MENFPKQRKDFTALNFSKLKGTQFVFVRTFSSEFYQHYTKCVEKMTKIIFVFFTTDSNQQHYVQSCLPYRTSMNFIKKKIDILCTVHRIAMCI